MISRKFIEAVKLAPKRSYRIAQEAGLHPTTLSKLVSGIERARPNDPRVLAIAKILGMDPTDCFEEKQPTGAGEEQRL